jgi:hypothetical protein
VIRTEQEISAKPESPIYQMCASFKTDHCLEIQFYRKCVMGFLCAIAVEVLEQTKNENVTKREK